MTQEKLNMRQQMPKTAKWVEERRAEWGRQHVDQCIRQAMAGKPGFFYAIEAGHVLGTLLPVMDDMQQLAVVTGCPFAGFMATPATEASDGAH